MPKHKLHGVIAAVPTPFDGDGNPDLERFVTHCRWALENGCDGLNVLGTTGEANSLSSAQRKAVMGAAASNLPRKTLMVGTGTPDLATTVDLTRHAHELGFAAALVLPPYYYKGVSDNGLFAWFAALVEATAGQPIPVYLYNFPQMTGIALSPALTSRLAASFPGRIAGAKDSSGDLGYAAEIARIEGFDVFPSSETSLGRARRDGYAGCISATVNVTAPMVAALWRDPGDGALLARVSKAREAIAAQPLIPSIKYLVGRMHGDGAYERLLPPHLPLEERQKRALDGFAIGERTGTLDIAERT
jgi:4-hydroxy-tetrahydrodipicolinate synthase